MTNELQMQESIAAFIEATNTHNTADFLAVFTDSAVITDEGQEYRGIAAIKAWSDEKYIGAKVTLDPVEVVHTNGNSRVTVKVDGSFDKTGLPDPFLMDFYFTTDNDRIAGLNLRLAGE